MAHAITTLTAEALIVGNDLGVFTVLSGPAPQ